MARLQAMIGAMWAWFAYIPDPRNAEGKSIWSTMLDWTVATLMDAVFKSMGGIEQDFAPTLKDLIDEAEKTGEVPAILQPILDELKDPTKPIAALLGQSAGSAATGGIISSTIGPYLMLLQYMIQRKALQSRFDIMTAMGIIFRRPDMSGLVESDLHDQGWSPERIRLLLDVSLKRLDEAALTTHRLRYGMTREDYWKHMGKLGYGAGEAEAYYRAQEYYPSPQDLVLWQAREVFEEGMVAKYGLDDELEGVKKEPFYKAHMDDDQIKNYWRAHWKHASWSEVQTMLFREQISEDDVRDWFRLVEIPPFWRDKLIATAYHPYTRVDVRRMHKIGVISPAELVKAYQDLGYNLERAQKMSEFTIQYNQGTDPDTARALTKADITGSLARGTISRLEAHDLLTDYGYSDEDATLILERPDAAMVDKVRTLTISNIRQLYERGLMPRAEAMQWLKAMKYTDTAIVALFKIWDWEKPTVSKERERDLTIGNLKLLYERGLRGKGQITSELAKLGYSEAEILALFALWDWERPLELQEKTRDLTLSHLRQLHGLGLRTELEITPFLAAMGYSPAEISTLFELWSWEAPPKVTMPSRTDFDKFLRGSIIGLGEWVAGYSALGYDARFQDWYLAALIDSGAPEPVEVQVRERDLTTSQIQQLYKRDLMPRAEADAALSRLGYDAGEISRLFALWDYSEPVEGQVRERDLATSQIQQLYKRDLMPRAEADAALSRLGYDATERGLLFNLWDYQAPE